MSIRSMVWRVTVALSTVVAVALAAGAGHRW